MNVKGKRLLILGVGRGQIGLYKAAREMGGGKYCGNDAGQWSPLHTLG